MTVNVAPGTGLIPTGTYPSSYNYRFHIDTALPGESVTIGTAASSPRIDYIVAYVDTTVSPSNSPSYVNNTNNMMKLADVQGTPAGSPSVPTVSQIQSTIGASNPYIILAQVYVGANVTQITSSNVADSRIFAADRNDAALGAPSYVDSGLVWTSTSGLAASMTAGKAYINVGGTMVPASASAISSYSFTASQDTYVSINVNGVVSYSAVTNNASSPALPANSVWLAIVVTNSSAISTINTGQIGASAPTISSRVLNISDSNGNLIYPMANQKILGYAQITSTFSTTSGSATQATGLSVTINNPYARRIKATAFTTSLSDTTGGAVAVATLWNGTVGSGTQFSQGNAPAGSGAPAMIIGYQSSNAGQHTYNVGLAQAFGGTANLTASSTGPATLVVELE